MPITYMSATLRPAVPEWPAGAYESALHAFIESLPMGKLVECMSGHDIPKQIPGQVVSEIEELLGRTGASPGLASESTSTTGSSRCT